MCNSLVRHLYLTDRLALRGRGRTTEVHHTIKCRPQSIGSTVATVPAGWKLDTMRRTCLDVPYKCTYAPMFMIPGQTRSPWIWVTTPSFTFSGQPSLGREKSHCGTRSAISRLVCAIVRPRLLCYSCVKVGATHDIVLIVMICGRVNSKSAKRLRLFIDFIPWVGETWRAERRRDRIAQKFIERVSARIGGVHTARPACLGPSHSVSVPCLCRHRTCHDSHGSMRHG